MQQEINIKNIENVNIKVGDVLYYPYTLHRSVGYDSRFEISDQNVIDLVDRNVEYKYPERMKDPNITGADNALAKFIFKAKNPGKSAITIYNEFRFEVESTEVINITVEH